MYDASTTTMSESGVLDHERSETSSAGAATVSAGSRTTLPAVS